jgi:glucokinase
MSIIGIDLGGTRIKIGIIADGQVQELAITQVTSKNGLLTYLPFLKSSICQLKERTKRTDIRGIGIAFPGLVDTEKDLVIATSKKYDNAPALDLVKWAEQELGLKLKIENDARLACMGEWKYGAGKQSANMVMCTLGTGVGSAAIIDGKMLFGKHFQAGVLGGHFIIDFENTENQCSCGNYGCVEATASTWVIEQLAVKHPLYSKSKLNKREKIDFAAVFELSALGDELSTLLRDHCMNAWAVGIINLIHAYDPEVVVIGGGIMHSKDIILPHFKQVIAQRAWCPSGIPDIRTADYPDTAALLGTALLFK